jgi:hypothetical protein
MHMTSHPYSLVLSPPHPYYFSPLFPRPTPQWPFSGPHWLSWSCLLLVCLVVWESQWELASCSCIPVGSLCPMSEPMGTDLLPCISLLAPI